MPLYTYECANPECPEGGRFTAQQRMADAPLAACPHCGGKAERVITPTGMAMPKGDADYKRMGFTKLVRRDKGVYENVTALDGESRYFDANKPGSAPDLSRRIED